MTRRKTKMQLTTNINIEDGIVTAYIKCTDISDETKEALHDYTKILQYGNIDFSSSIKVTDGMPEIVSDDDTDGEEVSIELIDKSFIVDENLYIKLILDSKKISESELTTSINNIEILSKAKALIWVEKVKDEIKKLVNEARKQNDANIEGTTEEIV